ncbi:MAG: flagellar motor switch protein FliM [Magnetovibrio sp.]|nr:flagellar motor switch protein FliM [Magnetovibrio sp.]|tara:strand:+ start:2428 stop:3513 length:1086 start_codon:yes stop_codon:yes gene_type:complete
MIAEAENDIDGGGGDEQDDLAAEWESMVSPDAANAQKASGGQTSRVLSQAEIDSLLGSAEKLDQEIESTGVKAMLNNAISYERLPMLEVVFDRLVSLMSTSLRNFTADNVEVSMEAISSTRVGDYLNAIPLPAMISVFKAEEWDNFGLITVDSALTYSMVDVLLGERRGTTAAHEGRPYTAIERSLVERMVHVTLSDLTISFEPLSPVTFQFERLETNPRFATISRPSDAAIVVKLRVEMGDRGGRMEMLLPYATLEPVRELLLQMFIGESSSRNSLWQTHLAEECWLTNVDLEVVLDEFSLKLNEVFSLEVGSQLILNATPTSKVKCRIGDVELYSGTMGRKGEKKAVKIEERLMTGEED